MAHAIPASLMNFGPGVSGIAGFKFNASHILKVEFTGQAVHAAGEPWKGVNALDAAVGAYTNIALLRQQTFPDERIHGVIEHGGMVPGIIPDYSRIMWYVRAPTIQRADRLLKRVKACIEAAMGMAMMAVRVLVDDNIAAAARADFEKDDNV